MFTIEDNIHAEIQKKKFENFNDAIEELKRLAKIPWDASPNRAPCTGWEKCGREYEIVEYDDSSIPWKKLNTVTIFEIDATGVRWLFSEDSKL